MVANNKNNKSNDKLTGMKEICRYLGKGESTVLQKHRDEGLPLHKGKDLIWHGSKKAIDIWKKKHGEKEMRAGNMA